MEIKNEQNISDILDSFVNTIKKDKDFSLSHIYFSHIILYNLFCNFRYSENLVYYASFFHSFPRIIF